MRSAAVTLLSSRFFSRPTTKLCRCTTAFRNPSTSADSAHVTMLPRSFRVCPSAPPTSPRPFRTARSEALRLRFLRIPPLMTSIASNRERVSSLRYCFSMHLATPSLKMRYPYGWAAARTQSYRAEGPRRSTVGVVRVEVHVDGVTARFPDVLYHRPFEADILEDRVALHACPLRRLDSLS